MCAHPLSRVQLFATPWTSPSGFSVHGILQARILEWVAISFSKGSSWPKDWTCSSWVSYTGRQIRYHCSTWEAQSNYTPIKNTSFVNTSLEHTYMFTFKTWHLPCGSAGKESASNVGYLVRSLGLEDPLEKGKATHSFTVAWRIPWTISTMGSWRVRHNWVTFTLKLGKKIQFSCSVVSDSLRRHGLQRKASLSITNSQSLLKLMSIELVMPSNHLILCHPLLLLPSIFPSIRVFSNESVLRIRWPKYWSFSFNISHFNEYSGLISFNMDWLDLLAVQGTLKSLLQHNSKASVLWRSAFFIVLLSHQYMTTGKTIALTRWTIVDKSVNNVDKLTKCLCFLICCLSWS